MQIYKIGIPEIAIAPMASKLKSSLQQGSTTWFLSGGSNIKLEVAIMSRIDLETSSNLTVTLADERFGAYNHPESNWTKLKAAGFDPKNARVIEIIQPDTTDIESATATFEATLEEIFEDCPSLIGQFGMGNDGHIAGILPHSPASTDLNSLVTSYASTPFHRISLTFNAIKKLNATFLIAMGEEKKQQLENLVNSDLALADQPAQIIKQVFESYLYNDQVERSNQ